MPGKRHGHSIPHANYCCLWFPACSATIQRRDFLLLTPDPCRRLWCKDRRQRRWAACETKGFLPMMDGSRCGEGKVGSSCNCTKKRGFWHILHVWHKCHFWHFCLNCCFSHTSIHPLKWCIQGKCRPRPGFNNNNDGDNSKHSSAQQQQRGDDGGWRGSIKFCCHQFLIIEFFISLFPLLQIVPIWIGSSVSASMSHSCALSVRLRHFVVCVAQHVHRINIINNNNNNNNSAFVEHKMTRAQP